MPTTYQQLEKDYHASVRALREVEAQRDELLAALKWVGDHNYAGGRSFKDVDPVKSALAKVQS